MCFGDFPSGPVVENPSCNVGDAGLIPDQGAKIPYAAGQPTPQLMSPGALESASQLERSPCATTKDPACSN